MGSDNYIAVDLGASNGRIYVSSDGRLEEIHRFTGHLINENGHPVWDIKKIVDNVLHGIKLSVQKYHNIRSIAIDSWGVDYVLMNNDQPILPVYSYRDQRTAEPFKNIESKISAGELYRITGIQHNQINTIYQLMADLNAHRLDNATDFLFIPEYITYLLTGKKVHEYTMASTSGLVNLKTGEYSDEIITKLGLPKHLFNKLVKPGYVVGPLQDSVAKEVGANFNVIMPATHDTASSFYAVDVDYDSVIISSGTWSLVGVKLPIGNTSPSSESTNFTNEGSVNFICYLKNIMGLWIFNEVKKCHQYSYDEISRMSVLKSSYNEVFDVNDSSLLSPTNMIDAIKKLLPANNQPKTDADIYRSIFRSLATAYKIVCNQLEKNLSRRYNRICISGGGANNAALNQFTQEITGREVMAIPMEASTMGNIKIQKGVTL